MYNFLEVLTISLMHLHDAHPFAHYVASCLHRIERAELCRYKLKQLCPVADSSGWNGVSGRKKKKGEGVNEWMKWKLRSPLDREASGWPSPCSK